MWHVSAEWKHQALEAMKAESISRAELARRVGVSDAAITQLFSTRTKQSRLVPAIHAVLGWTPPVQSGGEIDSELAELIDLWGRMDDKARKAILGTAGVLAKPKA